MENIILYRGRGGGEKWREERETLNKCDFEAVKDQFMCNLAIINDE